MNVTWKEKLSMSFKHKSVRHYMQPFWHSFAHIPSHLFAQSCFHFELNFSSQFLFVAVSRCFPLQFISYPSHVLPVLFSISRARSKKTRQEKNFYSIRVKIIAKLNNRFDTVRWSPSLLQQQSLNFIRANTVYSIRLSMSMSMPM